MTESERLAGQLDVDEVLELVVRDEWAPARASVRGELVAPAADLVERFTATLVARPQTQRTYALACARFVRWLGPLAGPEDLTAANIAAYHAHLVAGGRSSATVRKDRAALNSLLRWLAEHELLPAGQAREALAAPAARATRDARGAEGAERRPVRAARARGEGADRRRPARRQARSGDRARARRRRAALRGARDARVPRLPARAQGREAARARGPSRQGRSPAPRVAQRRGVARDRAPGPRTRARSVSPGPAIRCS